MMTYDEFLEGKVLKAPFPYFGGKSAIAPLAWQRFGNVPNYVEPFFGSGAVLLARETEPHTETVNDADGLLCNFWRALAAAPEKVAHFADWPVNENDLHARHAWLVSRKDSIQATLEGDPEWFDPKAAGWWVWGICCWIGSGWCSGNGPWRVEEGQLVHAGSAGQGINRQLVHAGDAGRGINRKRERLSGFGETGVNANEDLLAMFTELANRLRRVRVCCGDWSRVVGPSVTFKHGLTAVFLDPPYAGETKRTKNLYRKDCEKVAHDVRKWAIENGENPLMRIALCGYDGEHQMPDGWECVAWKAKGGFGSQAVNGNENCKRERVWFSPHCEKAPQPTLFDLPCAEPELAKGGK